MTSSELFKLIFIAIGKANESQDEILNRRIVGIIENTHLSVDEKTFKIIEMFNKYSDVCHAIAFVDVISQFIKLDIDADLYDKDQIIALISETC